MIGVANHINALFSVPCYHNINIRLRRIKTADAFLRQQFPALFDIHWRIL